MKHTSKLLTALLLTMAFLVSALPVHGIHAEPETATVQKKAELVFVIDSTGSMSGSHQKRQDRDNILCQLIGDARSKLANRHR